MATQQPLHILVCSTTSEVHLATNSLLSPTAPARAQSSSPETPLGTHSNLSSAAMTCVSNEERRETVDMDVLTLLSMLNQVTIDSAFAVNGYKKLYKICDTLQGTLYKAQKISTGEYVAIKKTEKLLSDQHISIDDETSFCVAEDIVKEAKILKHITVDNTSIGNYIIQYIDYFTDDSAYYLVMEYIESEMNLKQFVSTAHQYIVQNKLQRKHFKRTMKYIYWQLAVTIRWLHDDMHCCHLDLCLANIMLKHCSFKEDKQGNMLINPSICIKLGDFGVAECFGNVNKNGFMCNKTCLSLESEPYLAPKVYAEDIYDARAADMWALGMIICESLAGETLYEPLDICMSDDEDASDNGYIALNNGDLKSYLAKQKSLKCFTKDSLHLLVSLLHLEEDKRLNAMHVLKHDWFKMYYKKYQKQIERKMMTQKKRLANQKKTDEIHCYDMIQY